MNSKTTFAYDLAGESTTRITALDGTDANDVIRKRNVEKLNNRIDEWAERFDKHSANIEEFSENLNKNLERIDIMPIGNYILVRPFEENPFQRIVRDSKSGLIIDTGGLAPEYKNTDNGEYEQEEQFIKVGVIQQVGPDCKWTKEGDAVFFAKNSAVPVPFYKMNLQLVNETRVLAVVNELLEERFAEIKKNEEKK